MLKRMWPKRFSGGFYSSINAEEYVIWSKCVLQREASRIVNWQEHGTIEVAIIAAFLFYRKQ